jgi:hypothetical protein
MDPSDTGSAAVTGRPSCKIVETLRTAPKPVCAAEAASSTSPTWWPVKLSLSQPAAARADAQ